MKRPDFEKWAKREMGRVREDHGNLNTGDAYERVAKIARGLGNKYSEVGEIAKANHQYGNAADAYDTIGLSRKRDRMLGKIVGDEMEVARRLGVVLGIVFLIVGFASLSVQFTGNSILNLSSKMNSFASASFFILGIFSFYFSIKKEKI